MSESANQDQIDFWNGWMGDRWVAHQEAMDELLQPLSGALIDAAAVQADEQVMDVGCGCGGTSLTLAAAGARVTGVDVSEPMLNHARQRAAGDDRLRFVLADASTEVFEPEFDVLFSRFGVMFFNDPVAAFTNLRTALKPGGRVCFLCWQRADLNSWVAVPLAAAQAFLPEAEPLDPQAPGPFAFADPDYVVGILDQAGFSDPRATTLDASIRLGGSPAEAAEFSARIGPVSRALVDLDDAGRQRVLDTVAEALTAHTDADGVTLGAACWIVTATAD
jgi:SAM-dependent methyltransferase